MDFVTLNNGVRMPIEGFGVFQIEDGNICCASCRSACLILVIQEVSMQSPVLIKRKRIIKFKGVVQ